MTNPEVILDAPPPLPLPFAWIPHGSSPVGANGRHSNSPEYTDAAGLSRALSQLETRPPLLAADEIERLRAALAEAALGRRFVLKNEGNLRSATGLANSRGSCHHVPMALPKWVTDNASSIREEAAPYVAFTPEQRAPLLAAACRAGAKLLRARPDAARILARTDPLPASSEQALARLRAQHASDHADTE